MGNAKWGPKRDPLLTALAFFPTIASPKAGCLLRKDELAGILHLEPKRTDM